MRMRSRIFLSICLASLVTLGLTLLLVTRVMYTSMTDELKDEVKSEAKYLSTAIETINAEGGGLDDYIAETGKKSVNRITLVAADGTVLYDNYAEPSQLDNHSGRPEIKDAINNGWGDITRSSDTLSEKTYYYAVKLNDGGVIRIASTTKSFGGLLGTSVIWLVIITIAVFVASVIIAKLLTDSLIKPINNLDLENPVANETYDELSPLLARMDKQNEKITEQVKKLLGRKREFEYIADHMTEGLVIFGKTGNILTANISARKIFGSDDDAATYPELSRNSDYIRAVESALVGKATDTKLEKDGRIFRLTVNPVEDTGKYGAVLFLIDITERESAEQMRREFSANVSHELKTPLTSIMGAAEIIENGIAKSEDIPHFAGQIHSEASRLLALIQDIIKLSRLDEEDLKQEFADVDLDGLCKTVIAELGCKAKDKNIKVSYKGESVAINGVRPVLHEMIYNLCDNAIVYNKEGGEVKVTLSEENGEKMLTVEDTGIGIAAEHQPRVFERFYRVDKSHSKETGGTGLGLSIVKHGAILHDGTISLESEQNKGTKITIAFH